MEPTQFRDDSVGSGKQIIYANHMQMFDKMRNKNCGKNVLNVLKLFGCVGKVLML